MTIPKQILTNRARVGLIYKYVPEEWMELLNLTLSILQLVACPGFYPRSSKAYYETSVAIFINSSIINMMIEVHDVLESHYYLTRHLNRAKSNTETEHETISTNMSIMQTDRKEEKNERTPFTDTQNGHFDDDEEEELGHHERKLIESILYVLSALVYAIGSIFFLPSVYKFHKLHDLALATWFFFFGSLMLIVATFVNSLSINMKGRFLSRLNPITKQLAVISLFSSLIAAVMYSLGSILFFPQFDGTKQIWNPVVTGTNFFVIGASLTVFSGFLNLIIALLKRKLNRLELEDDGCERLLED